MKDVAVMDIGTSKIGVLVGSKGINNSFNVAGSYEYPYAGYFEGEFVEPDNLSHDVSNALSKAEINSGEKIEKIFIGVPADFSTCITKTFNQNFGDKLKVSESDILEIYQQVNELRNNENYILISCSAIYFVLDDGRKVQNPVGEQTTRLSGEISYIYAEKSFITKINTCLRTAGISVVEYLSSPLCENLYLLSESDRENPCVVIDCGYISTSVSIVKGNGLKLLNTFSVGGGQVTSDLMECLKISYNEAEELKKQIILSVIPELSEGYEIHRQNQTIPLSMKESNEIVCARLDMLCSLINKCLNVVSKQELNKMKFYLTGGGISFIKGSKDYLSKKFGFNIEILSPPNLQLTKPSFSVMLGLLDRAIKQQQKRECNKFIQFIKRITKR